MSDELRLFLTTGFSGQVVSLIVRVLVEILIFLVGTQIIKILLRLLKKTMERVHAEKGVTQFVCSFVKVALYVFLVFIVATNLGLDAATAVAVLGSAGVAIGLAVQGSLSNMAGGVLILLTKPFVVGDYIVENGGKMEGEVVEIHIFCTKLKTPDHTIVVLPNGNLANNSLMNYTSVRTRRMDIPISIAYNADIEKAKQVLMEVIENDPAPCKDMDRLVFVNALKDSCVELGVRLYTTNEDFWAAKWRITENCKLALDKNGIVIPFPQMDVHISKAEEMT